MAVLVIIVVIGIMTTVVAQTWKSVYRIEKENELIWVGHQFRNAIEGYYKYRMAQRGGAPGNYYPTELRDLLSDPGRAGGYSWLRKIYKDPITGKDDWVLIRTPGGIKGVRSASDKQPLRIAGFDVKDSSFTGKKRYSEWVFEYPPVIQYTGPPVPGYIGKAIGAAGGKAGGGWDNGGWPTEHGGSTGWPAQQPSQQPAQQPPSGGGWPSGEQ
jgi:type II secretory pathway pseudopilin PulG